MQRAKYIYTVFYLIILLALSGCSSKLTFIANADQSTNMDFSVTIGKQVEGLIESMMAKTQEEQSSFPVERIQEAFKDSDFMNIKVSATGFSNLNISGILQPSQSQRYMAGSSIKTANFVTCARNTLTLIISPETIQNIALSLPDELRSYIDVTMAPVFTGESMSAQEYRSLIAAVYGEDFATELDKATVDIVLAPPAGRKIVNSSFSEESKARATAARAIISIRLIDLLTQEKLQTYSISW